MVNSSFSLEILDLGMTDTGMESLVLALREGNGLRNLTELKLGRNGAITDDEHR